MVWQTEWRANHQRGLTTSKMRSSVWNRRSEPAVWEDRKKMLTAEVRTFLASGKGNLNLPAHSHS
jgi:hypothetical protein